MRSSPTDRRANLRQLVIASSNEGKIRELTAMLPRGLELIPQSHLGIEDIAEEETTFAGNAVAKAENASRLSGLPAMADDSGLEVDALQGAPGVYSSRYAGPDATDAQNVRKLLGALEGVPEARRTARFRCVIALVMSADDPDPLVFEGRWEGSILTAPAGKRGFGYDPVFFVPACGSSAAELEPEVKNRLSHRARALEALAQALGLDRKGGLEATQN